LALPSVSLRTVLFTFRFLSQAAITKPLFVVTHEVSSTPFVFKAAAC